MNVRKLMEDPKLRCLVEDPHDYALRRFTKRTRQAISVSAVGKRLGGENYGASCVAATFLLSDGSYLRVALFDTCCLQDFSHGALVTARGGRASVVEAEVRAQAAEDGFDADVG